MHRVSRQAILWTLALLALATLVVAPMAGRQWIPVWSVLDDTQSTILWGLRVPRVLMAMLAGSVLATGGMTFQAMFRNSLATPFTLGIASGASLGASFCIIQGFQFALLGIPAVTWFGLLGAVLTMCLVYALAQTRMTSDSTLLLAGVAVSFSFSSLILFMQYIADLSSSFRMIRWVMGGLGTGITYTDLLVAMPVGLVGIGFILLSSKQMNLITTGDETAMARGLDVVRFKRSTFLLASVMIGAVVAACGPIGFVGLIVPHIARMLVGNDHRYLAPATVLLGMTFLVGCDTLGRCIFPLVELPVGIITALLGGPFFLLLLLTRRV